MRRNVLDNNWWNYVLFGPDEGGAGGAGGSDGTGGNGDGGSGGAGGAGDTWYAKAGAAPEHHDWMRNKEFADLNTTLASYRSLEGTIGRQRLAVPKDAADQAAYDALYTAIGRPPEAKGYKLPEGVKLEPKVWDRFSGLFHKHGVSQAAAEAIVKDYHTMGTELTQAGETERLAEEGRQEEALKKAWGKDFDAKSDIAGRAWRALGVTEELSDKLESTLGFKAFTEFFHKVGAGMTEAALKTDGGQGGGGGDNVQVAMAARDRLMGDPEFLKRYQNSNQAIRQKAIDEIQPYFKIIAAHKDSQAQGRGG